MTSNKFDAQYLRRIVFDIKQALADRAIFYPVINLTTNVVSFVSLQRSKIK